MSIVAKTPIKSVVITSAAASEPITLTEAKTQLRVTDSNSDTEITSMITAAREMCESFTNSHFINTTLRMAFSYFPSTEIRLYGGRISSVTNVKYYDSDNSIQTWASSNYSVNTDAEPCLIFYGSTATFPSIYTGRSDAIQVNYISGYGSSASDVPMSIKQACLMTITHLFENRQNVVFGTPNKMPMASEWLLEPYKITY